MSYRILWRTAAGGTMRPGFILATRAEAEAYSLDFVAKASRAVSHTLEETDAPATHTLLRGRLKRLPGVQHAGPGAAYYLSGRAASFADRDIAPAAAETAAAETTRPRRSAWRIAWRVLRWSLLAVLAWKAVKASVLLLAVAPIVVIGMLHKAIGDKRNRME